MRVLALQIWKCRIYLASLSFSWLHFQMIHHIVDLDT